MKKIKLIALFAAIIAALAVYQFLKEVGKPQETPRTGVVVAAVDIPENTLITPEMVVLRPVATEALLDDHLLDPEAAVGMVTSGDVFAGEQITARRLVRMGEAESDNTTLAYMVEAGMRAVTISVGSTSGNAYMIKPGNRVDLVLNYTEERPSDNPQTPNAKEQVPVSRLLLQNVEVLAVGSVLSRDGTAEYATITFQVTPEEAVKISFAESNGSLRLILRSSLDSEHTDEIVVDRDQLIESGQEAGT